jgi:hypothetical protein
MSKRRHYLVDFKPTISRRDKKDTKLSGSTVDDLVVSLSPDAIAAINADADQAQRGVKSSDIKGNISHTKTIFVEIRDAVIQTTESPIPHKLGKVPVYYHINVKSTGYTVGTPTVWETRKPDATAIYLQADTAAYVDIIVRG